MVAFVPANLPSNCNTVEKVAVWAASVMSYYIPNEKIFEAVNRDELQCEQVIVPMLDGQIRQVGRLNIPLDPLYRSNGKKLWENAVEMKVVALSTTFTTNSTVA